jgi:hypothetical protein
MASVHDARNDAIFGKQLTVYSQPPTMTTPTQPLSPAAQAVWDAWNDAYEAQGPLEDMGYPLGAALIAAVKQVAPPERNPHGHTSEREEEVRAAVGEVLGELLALANELRQEGRA